MSFADVAGHDGSLEECLDELDGFVAGLTRYAPSVLAVALRVHLGALLHALLETQECTRAELRDFLRELERDSLQHEES